MLKPITILSCCLILLLFPGCNRIGSYTKSGLYFDTLISITIYESDAEKAEELLNESLKLCEYYEGLFSPEINSSDISRLNSSAGKITEINPETITLLEKGINYAAISDNSFDITIAGVTSLWDFNSQTGEIPSSESIKEQLPHVGIDKLIINSNDNTAELSDQLTSIDPGGLAKGYIADKLADYLRTQNVYGAIINLGGDISTIGNSDKNKYFTIGINNPDNSGTPLFPIYITNKAVATSGTYERFLIDENGNKHCHIIDPKTGMSVNTDICQASVITKNAIDADSYATICILKGSRDALSFIENIDNTEAVLITDDGQIIKSSGMGQYLNP